MTTFRLSTFNVENLFSRARVMNFMDHTHGIPPLKDFDALKKELAKSSYDQVAISKLYKALKDYIKVDELRGRLFRMGKAPQLKDPAHGRDGWVGSIELRREQLQDSGQQNTARIVDKVHADIQCLMEVEDRWTLEQFNHKLLKHPFTFDMLIDGNDDRGIDVALLSNYAIGAMTTHIFDTDPAKPRSRIFSRDCLEAHIALPGGKRLTILINHLKSKLGGASNARRELQATRVKEILSSYNLTTELVAVVGDFNDTPDSAPLQSLLTVPNLSDVLHLKSPGNAWTYYYDKKQQIDYVLVSDPLKAGLQAAGVERSGIFDIVKISGGADQALPQVKTYRDSASDHGAVWADFNV